MSHRHAHRARTKNWRPGTAGRAFLAVGVVALIGTALSADAVTPPEHVVRLTELSPADFSHSPGGVEVAQVNFTQTSNKATSGGSRPSGVDGERFRFGLGVQTDTTSTYDLAGEYQRFETSVVVDESVLSGGSVIFAVDVDGERRFTSPPMTGTHDPRATTVDVAGARRLTLIVKAVDAAGNHRADWVSPTLYAHRPPRPVRPIAAPTPTSPSPSPTASPTTGAPPPTMTPPPPTTTSPTSVPPTPTTTTATPAPATASPPPMTGGPADGALAAPSNTGVPSGWSPAQTVNGNYRVTTPGAVVEDLRVTGGSLIVEAPNVTVRRVEVLGGVINNAPGGACNNGLTVEQTTIRRMGATAASDPPAVGPGGYTARSVKIEGLPEGFRVGGKSLGCGPVLLEDSFAQVQRPDVCGDWHGDGIQGYDGAALTVRNVTLELVEDGCGGTAPFFYPAGQGNVSVDIDGMLVKGGGYPFRLGTAGSVKGLRVVDESWHYGASEVSCSALTAWEAEIVAIDGNYQPVGNARGLQCGASGDD